MKHILIPTDFSKNSYNAIRYALSFFEESRVTFHLLHVDVMAEIPVINRMPEAHEIQVKEKLTGSRAKLKALGKEIALAHPNTNHFFCLELEKSSFIEGVRKLVLEKKIDLIIMGTKGSSIENDNPIGKNTVEVITRVKCPVLVIPEKAVYSKPKNIVFPTDFTILYKNRVLTTLGEILEINSSSLRILNIRKRDKLSVLQQKNKEFLIDSLLHERFSLHSPENTCIEQALQEFINQNPIDMIAMAAKNLNFFQRILFKPLKKGTDYQKKIPILVLHE